jgi:hypothetical protein
MFNPLSPGGIEEIFVSQGIIEHLTPHFPGFSAEFRPARALTNHPRFV